MTPGLASRIAWRSSYVLTSTSYRPKSRISFGAAGPVGVLVTRPKICCTSAGVAYGEPSGAIGLEAAAWAAACGVTPGAAEPGRAGLAAASGVFPELAAAIAARAALGS